MYRPTRARHPLDQLQRLRLVSEIVATYVQARSTLRGAPIASVVATLRSDGARASRATSQDTLEEARRLGRAAARTLALLPGDTRCLVRSLVLTRMLARRGISGKLVIGARADPSFLAHAWVEHAGQPVLSSGDGAFARLVEL